MAHFARVVDGIVVDLIVAESDHITNGYVGDSKEWIQTSYNTRGGVHYLPDSTTPSPDQSKAFRYNYATVGGVYDHQKNAFIRPIPFSSFVFNSEVMDWDAPVANTLGPNAIWDDINRKWVIPSI